jgi:hypothetical protein
MLRIDRLESQIIKNLSESKETNGPKLDSQNWLRSPMAEVLIIITLFKNCEFQLRNKSWKPECDKPMLKLKTHSGFHDLFRF